MKEPTENELLLWLIWGVTAITITAAICISVCTYHADGLAKTYRVPSAVEVSK